MNPVVVIGTGLAGFNVVKELRKLDKETPVVMITADDGRNYSKPMLSTGFTKEKAADELAMATPEKTAEQFDVEMKTFTEVKALHPADHEVELGDGSRLAYSKLVLAWGADVFRPPLEGDATDQVYSVNDLMDYGEFRKALDGKKKVLIIGGGLIGCEFANDLSNGGFEVELVEPMGAACPRCCRKRPLSPWRMACAIWVSPSISGRWSRRSIRARAASWWPVSPTAPPWRPTSCSPPWACARARSWRRPPG